MKVQSQFIEMFEKNQYDSYTLDSIAFTWLKGQPFKKDEISMDGKLSCIHYGELFTKYGPIIKEVYSRTISEMRKTSVSGDILFPASDVTPNGLSRCSMLPFKDVILGGDIIVLRLKNEYNPSYISYAINQQKDQLMARVNGGVVKHMSAKSLKSVTIPIPPMPLQQQFVSIAKQADKSKFVGFKSQFIEMFGKDTPTYKISEVCDVRGGSTPTRTNKEFWNGGDVSWFTIEDIYEQGRYIYKTKQHITELATKKCFVYPIDTVLICCTASVGEYAITKKKMASNQQFNGMIIKDKEQLHPEYLLYVASTLKEVLLRQAGKTTINFVSRAKLEAIEIPVPSYNEQITFVSILQQADKSKYFKQIA